MQPHSRLKSWALPSGSKIGLDEVTKFILHGAHGGSTTISSVEPTTDAEKIEQIRTLLDKPSGLMAYNTLTQIREILDQK